MPIDDKFKEIVESGLGCAVIIAGSGSDKPHIEKIAAGLEKYGVPYQVRVASGHKQSRKFQRIVDEYDALSGSLAYILVAGATDAISGTSSFTSYRPSVSCPPDHPNMSCISNPPGSSNAYVGRPDNAARFVAQMFAKLNPKYEQAIIRENESKISSLEKQDLELMREFDTRQGR